MSFDTKVIVPPKQLKKNKINRRQKKRSFGVKWALHVCYPHTFLQCLCFESCSAATQPTIAGRWGCFKPHLRAVLPAALMCWRFKSKRWDNNNLLPSGSNSVHMVLNCVCNKENASQSSFKEKEQQRSWKNNSQWSSTTFSGMLFYFYKLS